MLIPSVCSDSALPDSLHQLLRTRTQAAHENFNQHPLLAGLTQPGYPLRSYWLVLPAYYHFYRAMEALMRLFAYKEVVAHKGRHEQFLTTLTDIERASIHLPDDGATCKRLADWFKNHMSVCDRGYVGHIRSGAPVVMVASSKQKRPKTRFA